MHSRNSAAQQAAPKQLAPNASASAVTVMDFSIFESGHVATLSARVDGRPIRRIIAGRQTKPVGFYYSEKCGRFMPYESFNELNALYIAEADFNVVSYRVQPHAIWLAGVEDRDPTYFPDREDILFSGVRRIVEIKKHKKFTPEYRAKITRAQLHYEHHDLQFEVLDRDDIERQPRFGSAEKLQAYKRTAITDADLRKLRELFHGRESICFGDARDVLGGRCLGFAKLGAMIVRRLVGIDLDGGIDDDTALLRVRL